MIRELFLRDLSLWTCLWQSSALTALGLSAGWLLRRRPARAYQVLLLAMTTAVAAPLLSAVVKHFNLGAFVATRIESPHVLQEIPFAMSAPAPDAGALQPAPPQSMPAGVVEPAPLRIPWQMVLRYGWLAVALALLGRLVATFLYGVHLVRHASRVPREDVQRAVDEARSKLAMPQELQIRASGPAMIGSWPQDDLARTTQNRCCASGRNDNRRSGRRWSPAGADWPTESTGFSTTPAAIRARE